MARKIQASIHQPFDVRLIVLHEQLMAFIDRHTNARLGNVRASRLSDTSNNFLGGSEQLKSQVKV